MNSLRENNDLAFNSSSPEELKAVIISPEEKLFLDLLADIIVQDIINNTNHDK